MKSEQMKSIVVIACLSTILAAGGFLFSFEEYLNAHRAQEIINAIAPLKNDRTVDFVEPLLEQGSHKETAIKLIQSSIEESRVLHQGWLTYSESIGEKMRTMCFIWGGVLLAFLSLLTGILRSQRAAAQQGAQADRP